MSTAIGYVRTSTAEQTTEKQRAIVEDLAQQRGLELIDVLNDAGISGATPLADRPAGAQLEARLGEVGHICVSRCDRLWRDLADAVRCLAAWQAHDVLIHTDSPPAAWRVNVVNDRLMLFVLTALAQHERETKSEATSRTMSARQAQGLFCGGGVPFGCDLRHGQLVPDPAEQEIIRNARVLRDAGWPLKRIGQALAGEHGPYHPQQVARMLKSEVVHDEA